MIAPWKFSCENLHIQFDAQLCRERLPSTISDALDFLPSEVKISQKVLLTISKIHSTCFTDNDFITSHEAILKIMIELHSVQYYFPVLAVVDAPHSITRGAFLGYTKRIGKVQLEDSFSKFELEGVENMVQFKVLPLEVEEILLLPHLTYRNYRTSDFQAKGLSVLDVENYITSPVAKCTSLKVHAAFLEKCGINPISSYKAGLVSDSFTVNGALYV